jgi:hypothetical protein
MGIAARDGADSGHNPSECDYHFVEPELTEQDTKEYCAAGRRKTAPALVKTWTAAGAFRWRRPGSAGTFPCSRDPHSQLQCGVQDVDPGTENVLAYASF